jgi:hypothetical protein
MMSQDQGSTWSEPKQLTEAPANNFGVLGQGLCLPGGEILLIGGSTNRHGVRVVTGSVSRDNGSSFGSWRDLITDPNGELNHDDPYFAIFPNGTIIATLWTYTKEANETIDVYRSISDDNGRSWSAPEPIGLLGQLTVPLALDDQNLIVVSNFRHPPEGIRLWVSDDRGSTFNLQDPIQMWDVTSEQVLGTAVSREPAARKQENIWDDLKTFSFGTPGLLRFGNGTILLTYYATVNGLTHIRACRLRLH